MDGVQRRSAVFAKWSKPSDTSPITFPTLTTELFDEFRSSGAVLARKFKKDGVNLESWTRFVIEQPKAYSNPSEETPFVETITCTSSKTTELEEGEVEEIVSLADPPSKRFKVNS